MLLMTVLAFLAERFFTFTTDIAIYFFSMLGQNKGTSPSFHLSRDWQFTQKE